MKIPKIKIKNNGSFYIKFRVNKSLYSYFEKQFITKTFSNKSLNMAKLERALIYKRYIEILELSFNSIIDKKFIHLKVNEFNQNLLKIKNKEKTFIDSRITILNAYEKFKKYYDSEQIKISTKNQTYVTLDLFLQLIGKNKFIEDIELYDLIDIKDKITKLGNKNFKEYKHLETIDYIKIKDVPFEKRINEGSVKNHLKHIKKFFVFCVNNRILKYNPSENLNIKVNLDKKDAFSQDEINKLIEIILEYENDLKYLYLIIIYTGMRRNEVFNCTIKEDKGLKYFDVYDSKTKNGIRKIPIHSKIDFITNEILENAKQITNSVNFGAIFNNKIKVLVTNDKRKTLHSIRHYVATKLKKNTINDSLIKSILGHSVNDTLNKIYAKDGYSLNQMKEIIEYL